MMEKMKDSGIRWIGEIPESWNTKRIKYVANLKGRIGWQGLTSEEYQDEGAFLITGVDFLDGGIDWENCYHVPMKRWEEAKDIQIQNGDLLITKDGTVGKVAIVSGMPGETSLNSGVLRIMPIEGYSRRFLYWVLQSEEFWNWFNYKNAGNSTIIHLYQGDFNEFVYVFPDYEHQEAIADYLDKHCAKLDGIISDLEVQIETLQKYKKSLITETVTKGLDKSVPMKNSGFEWIGQIPEHWELKRLKYMLEDCKDNLRVGPFGSALSTDEYTEEGKWVYTQRIVLDNNFESNDTFIDEKKFNELKGFKVRGGDILITTRGTIGKVAIVPEECEQGILHPCLIRFRVNTDFISRELIELIFNECDFVTKQFTYMSNATTIDVIYSYSLKDIILPIIPSDEQKRIAKFLKAKCSAIDAILNGKIAQLNNMKAHKESLIFEYVTGKKRIKEAI
jgi:type I restriction enzyme S subunit